VRKVRADINDAEPLDQKLAEFIDARDKRIHLRHQPRVTGLGRCLWIQVAHHPGAGGGSGDNGLHIRGSKDLHKVAHEGERFLLVARVVVHLSAVSTWS
jgi:hypothetical protein